ncbi:DUF6089 family protein [Flavobacterium sp. SM2513]|uniref:type IX secretion system protein PorG n=1 Tax=Flavobacterium sp. SM2513 TaxID=3424766 RepID=UPI003D7F6710
MNRLIYSFLLLVTVSASAQIHEIGVFAGGSNFIGDVGETSYIKPNEYAFGFIYKWNRSTRHSWRFSATIAKITADDDRSEMTSRKVRDYDFENTVKEVSLGLEFNFFEFDLHQLNRQFTPYVFLGLAYTNYDGLFYATPNNPVIDSNRGTLSVPFAFGVKTSMTKDLIIGFEIAPRYTFADDIDGSFSKNDDLKALSFGNINSNDWYVFTGFTLTYTFGRKPCFCD